MRGVLDGVAPSRYWRSVMTTSLDDRAAQNAQRAAMLRVFGGVLLAFFALLAVAIYVRPDLMQLAMDVVKSMRRTARTFVLSPSLWRRASSRQPSPLLIPTPPPCITCAAEWRCLSIPCFLELFAR